MVYLSFHGPHSYGHSLIVHVLYCFLSGLEGGDCYGHQVSGHADTTLEVDPIPTCKKKREVNERLPIGRLGVRVPRPYLFFFKYTNNSCYMPEKPKKQKKIELVVVMS